MNADNDVVIEILDQVSNSELSEFTETNIVQLNEIEEENQEILIQKYVNGEISFPDYYTQYEADEDDIDDDVIIKNTVENPQPSTSSRHLQINNIDINVQRKDKRQIGTGGGEGLGVWRRRNILSPALQGLMGEANLSFARGKNDMAEKICLEIIRLNPLAPEPFFTLAQIYESKDAEKFLNFSTIAAHLDPTNRDQWIRCAEMHIELKNYQQARILYSKAIKYLPKDFDIRLRKAKLLELMGEKRESMLAYFRLISMVPSDRSELCIVTAKNCASYFYEIKKMSLALDAMRIAYSMVQKLFTTEDINLYLELLMINKCYDKVLLILNDVKEIKLEFENDGRELIIITCDIPDKLIAEFRVKLCVSLIHCKAFHLLKLILTDFSKNIPIDGGIECYVDVCEALMIEEKYEETLEFLNPVIYNNINYLVPPYVWLKHAECYHSLNLLEEAIQSYYEVVFGAKYCYEARFTLSALLKQQGRHREAIKVLEQDMDSDMINPRLLYEHCLMLKTVDDIEQYLNVGYMLLSRHSLKFRSREEIITFSNGCNYFNSDSYKTIVESRLDKDIDDEQQPEYNETDANLSTDEEYELFLDITKTAFERKQFGFLQKISFAMATSKRFKKYRDIEKTIMLSSLFNNDPLISFYFLRDILPKNLYNNAYWNFLNIIIQIGDETRYHRFLKRIFERFKCPSYFKILLGNYHLFASSYKYALNNYVPIFNETNDPLACLCIAVCFTQISLQKNSLKKSTGISQGIAFIKKYSEIRMSSATKQEIYYNLGRMHHQCGTLHLALYYYEQALEVTDKLIEENLNILSLKEEIAFNIHLIYKASGNIEMARHYLYKYIEI